MKKWQLQEAKAHFSELVREAKVHGPQHITVHGREEVVMVSTKDFEKLKHTKETLLDFIRHSPLYDSGVDFERGRDPERGTPFEFPS